MLRNFNQLLLNSTKRKKKSSLLLLNNNRYLSLTSSLSNNNTIDKILVIAGYNSKKYNTIDITPRKYLTKDILIDNDKLKEFCQESIENHLIGSLKESSLLNLNGFFSNDFILNRSQKLVKNSLTKNILYSFPIHYNTENDEKEKNVELEKNKNFLVLNDIKDKLNQSIAILSNNNEENLKIFSVQSIPSQYNINNDSISWNHYEYYFPLELIQKRFEQSINSDGSKMSKKQIVDRFHKIMKKYEGIKSFHNFSIHSTTSINKKKNLDDIIIKKVDQTRLNLLLNSLNLIKKRKEDKNNKDNLLFYENKKLLKKEELNDYFLNYNKKLTKKIKFDKEIEKLKQLINENNNENKNENNIENYIEKEKKLINDRQKIVNELKNEILKVDQYKFLPFDPLESSTLTDINEESSWKSQVNLLKDSGVAYRSQAKLLKNDFVKVDIYGSNFHEE